MPDSLDADIAALAEYSKSCSWLKGYGAVSEIIKMADAKRILEIGVAYGYHALHLLETCPTISYVGVDPFLADYDPSDPFALDVERLFPSQTTSYNSKNLAMSRLHRAVEATIKRKQRNAEVFRETFLAYSRAHSSERFDLIYIDGNHTEDAVFSDIILSLKQISRKGYICGDDIERDSVRFGLLKAAHLYGLSPRLHTHRATGKVLWVLPANDIEWIR